jgi:hypothetical protein
MSVAAWDGAIVFAGLEEPGPDENPITVPIEPQPREIVAQILSALNAS